MDEGITANLRDIYGFTDVSGGGTAYAWRNDVSGPIAVTGADDRWWFFAVDMDLPGERQIIDIGSAEELAKIGHEPGYLISGRYRLTADIDLNGSVRGKKAVGALVGYLYGGGTVRRCESFAEVTGEQSCGGIVGYIFQYGTIRSSYQTGCVQGTEQVGGVVGVVQANFTGSDRSAVLDCYNAGAVSGETADGGVVGWAAYADLENCYSYAPGLPAVGTVYADEGGDTATVTGCYGRSETTGEGFLTTAQFRRTSSFAGWDFENVWTLENGVRPVLQSNPETIAPAPDPAPWYPDVPSPAPEPKPAEQPKQAEPVAFGDVAETDWFYAAVQFVAQKGYFLGTGNGTFSPTLPMTRGMFLTVLARLAGETIEGADWQAKAVAWAVENGVSDGSSPGSPITREQIVTMLWRALGKPAGSADLSGFSDAGEISDWASDAMHWAVGIGLIQGRGGGILAPGGDATRAEVAQLLMNYLTQESC